MQKIISLLIIFVSFLAGSFKAGGIGGERTSGLNQDALNPETDTEIYLPIIVRDYPPPIFGVETINFETWKLDRAIEANAYWQRNAVFSWAAIEPVRVTNPVYHWEYVNEAGLIESANRNLKVIATIKQTPTWAQKIPGFSCGPIAEEDLDEFYQFVYATVRRYSAPPYNIRYWEFGNEPDVDYRFFINNPDSEFGCWGDMYDPYYGGRYYAEMLKRAYPAVKAADPKSKVLIGGLLLDCDPTHVPPGVTNGCLPAKFLEGILRNQGASNFDYVAFHTYTAYFKTDALPVYHILDEDYPSFSYRGGQVVGKIDYLRAVMAAYSISKPIFLSEVSMICDDSKSVEKYCTTNADHFEDLQADFVVSANLRSWGLGLTGAVWYTLEDSWWRNSGLHNEATPKPGYYALKFMAEELKDGTAGLAITQYTGLRGYTFQLPTKKVWVLWSPDGVTAVQIPLPAGTTMIYDKFGNPIDPMPDPIQIIHPTYFEFPP